MFTQKQYTDSMEDTWTLGLAALLVAWGLLWLWRDRLLISDVEQRHVFITGCDSGFGSLLCKRLERRGFRVLAGCLTEAGATELRRATGPNLRTCLLDVADSESVRRAAEWAKEEVGDKGERTAQL